MHDRYARPNSAQTPAERRFKYQILRLYGLSLQSAKRLRDWNWSPMLGAASTELSREGKSIDGLKELCIDGDHCFKHISKNKVEG